MIFLYKGLAYPVKASKKGLLKTNSDIDLIKSDIKQILITRKGERVMLPEFGSKILDFIHEPLDNVTCSLIRNEIINAVSKWENRITVNKNNTTVTPYPDLFMIKAVLSFYTVINSQEQQLVLEISKNGGVTDWQD